MQRLWALLVHLRLHFQVLLAPIFLWGFLLAGGRPDAGFWLAFVAIHVCLYGGITAYNSYYDRDEGPVGGLERPPQVQPEVLPFSLVVQGIGALMCLVVNPTVLALYVVIALLAAAYSHPRIRLKGRPVGGLAVVALGQGLLAALAGTAVVSPGLGALDPLGWLGIVAASGLITGFYPITQVYQVEEDTRRGDFTFAAWAGPRGTFIFACSVMLISVLGLGVTFNALFGPLIAGEMVLLALALLGYLAYWGFSYRPADVLINFRRVMRLYTLLALSFSGFLLFQLFVGQPIR